MIACSELSRILLRRFSHPLPLALHQQVLALRQYQIKLADLLLVFQLCRTATNPPELKDWLLELKDTHTPLKFESDWS